MNVNVELLKAIANASAAGTVVYVDAPNGQPLAQAKLIAVNPANRDPNDGSKIAASITDEGVKYLASLNTALQSKPVHTFSVQSGITLPTVKRGGGGGGGAPTKYPFETMGIGDFFFVANTEVEKGDAVKTLSSAAGSANQRYAEDVIENGQVKMKTVTRAKRGEGNKAVKGPDGKNVMETVTVAEKRQTRKFVVRPVKGGVTYGSYTAPADGAVIARVELKSEAA